jgi:hypothetical protein
MKVNGPGVPNDADSLRAADPMTRTIYLLGTLPDAAKVGRSNAILKIERSPLDAEEFGAAIRKGLIQAVEVLGITDIVSIRGSYLTFEEFELSFSIHGV